MRMGVYGAKLFPINEGPQGRPLPHLLGVDEIGTGAALEALRKSIGKAVPVRYEGRIIEGMKATLLNVDTEGDWVVADFEIEGEVVEQMLSLKDYTLGELNGD